jgi:hypothetical protein
MKKKLWKKIIIGFLILSTIVIAVQAYPILKQEENPVQVINGIVQLSLRGLDLYEYDSNPISKQYITTSKDGFEFVRKMLEDEGWLFNEQFGSGYLFEYSTNEKENISISSIQFTRYFKLWLIPHTAF